MQHRVEKPRYCIRVAIQSVEVDAAAERVAAAALAEARTAASQRLLAWLAQSGAVPRDLADQPTALTDVLLARDPNDPRYQVLGTFAGRWAADVLRILASAILHRRGHNGRRTPDVAAVEYAVSVGATWATIGGALGISAPTAHSRYRDKVSQRDGSAGPESPG